MKYRRFSTLSLFLSAIFISISASLSGLVPAGHPESDISQAGQDLFLAHAGHCLDAMERTALGMGVQGVALVAYIPGEKTVSWISQMKVVEALTSGSANFLSVAYSKAGEMADTFKDSGGRTGEPLHGEFGYQGGVIEKVGAGHILAVFSGATGEQDTEIARKGLEELKRAFDQ